MSNFYIEAIEATTITLSKVGSPTVGTALYSIGSDNPTTSYTYDNSINLSAGQKCYWTITSTTTAFNNYNCLKFTSTGNIKAGGNLSSLIGGSSTLPRDYCFCGLFRYCSKLIDASAINFGSITSFNSKTGAYMRMFSGCTSLTAAPELPATTLASSCYSYMFQDCTSLTIAPVLPATTLSYMCYYCMFDGCTGLITAPKLPATNLEGNCYSAMFQGCTSLVNPPELPATTLATSCYQAMFYGCTGLIILPELHATTLANYCYYTMFYGCTGIKLSAAQTGIYQEPYRIPKEGTGTTASDALTNMFAETGGTFTGTPTINTTYYVPPSPALIVTYDHDIIYSDNGVNITLSTNNKLMSGNVNVVLGIKNGDDIY